MHGSAARGPALTASFMVLCVVLGGASAAAPVANACLQIIAVILIAWCLAAGSEAWSATAGWFLGTAVGLGLVDLLPLPASALVHLPFRDFVGHTLALAHVSPGPGPLSLTPHRTVSSLLALLPAGAMAAAMLHLDRRRTFFPAAVVALAMVSITVAVAQVAAGAGSALYFYEITNRGWGVGFFANKNHLATLTLVSLPCLAWLYASALERDRSGRFSRTIAFAGAATFLSIGTLITGSDAGLVLLLPVLTASVLVIRNARVRLGLILGCVGLAVALLVAAIVVWPSMGALISRATGEVQDRRDIWALSFEAVKRSFPFGTGLGSYPSVMRLLERPDQVTNVFINHAHNDYLEILVETGLVGVILVSLFLTWWCTLVTRIWSSDDRLGKAASVITAIVLVHSAVDYPLRTAAIMSVMGGALVVMARSVAGRTGTLGEAGPLG